MWRNIILLLPVALAPGCTSVDLARLPDPHRHFGNVHMQDPSTNVMSGVVFRLASHVPTNTLLSVRRPDGHGLAYTADSPVPGCNYEPEMLFLVDPWTGKTYRLENLHFLHRYIRALEWIDTRFLCFDIWTGPHFGVHYVIDTRTKRLIHATHFHDDFIEELERKAAATPARGAEP